MYCKNIIPTLVFTMAVLSLTCPVLAQVSADDFLPPVLGGPTGIAEPAKVRIEGDVVQAATAQDAINAAVKENTGELEGGDSPEVGAKMVTFPSGLGFVATGIGTYREMQNPTATRIAKRKAYVVAFTQAKKNLAEILGGLSNDGRETIREALSNITLPADEMTNISTDSEEALQQAVEMMLRGFVVYEVTDDEKQNAVFATIVTTPKTRGKLARPAPHVVEVDDLRDGLNQVIAEVKSGLVPPVGGRIITMRTTGETAFVGFGSAVTRTNNNAAVQSKLNYQAKKIAGMRAKDALCGLVIGDRTSWQGSVVDSLRDEIREFEPLEADDPLAETDPVGARKLEETRQTFVAKLKATDHYESARRGILPPGVNSKTWFDEDNAWAYGMAVYVPSLTNAAAETAREMMDAQIAQPVDDGQGQPNASQGFADVDVDRPGKKIKQGPTGKVGEDDDL